MFAPATCRGRAVERKTCSLSEAIDSMEELLGGGGDDGEGRGNTECIKGEVISTLGRVKATLEWLKSGSTDPPACSLSMEGAMERSTIDWLDEGSAPPQGFAQWLQAPKQLRSPGGVRHAERTSPLSDDLSLTPNPDEIPPEMLKKTDWGTLSGMVKDPGPSTPKSATISKEEGVERKTRKRKVLEDGTSTPKKKRKKKEKERVE